MSGITGSPIQGESYSVLQIISMMLNSSNILMGAGETTLTVVDKPINIIYLSATAAETITSISAIQDGYIIIIIAEDNNVTIQSNADIDLNSLPVGTDFAMRQYDILTLISKNNVYQELFRTEKN